jgi:hypothetical protein
MPRRQGIRRSTQSRGQSASCGTGRQRSSRPPACCATSPRLLWRIHSSSARPPPAHCSSGSPRRSRPSRWRALRSARCRSGDGCGRSAAKHGWGNTSPSCGSGCTRAPRRGSASTCPCGPHHRRCSASLVPHRRSARLRCSGHRQEGVEPSPVAHTPTPASSCPRCSLRESAERAAPPEGSSWPPRSVELPRDLERRDDPINRHHPAGVTLCPRRPPTRTGDFRSSA